MLDELIVDKATDFIKREAKGDKPFFTYVALSHVHPPEKAHPDFHQTDPTRLGLYADLMAEMDHRVGQIVDCVEEAGIADDTVIVFSSDNATCVVPAFGFGGSNGPWRGDFSTPPSEGSMRVAAMVRCPGGPAGLISEEMLSATTGTRRSPRWPGLRTRCQPTDRWTASTPRSSSPARARRRAGKTFSSSVRTES